MSKSRRPYPAGDDIDLASLGAALWRAKGWILSLVLLAGVVTFVGLSMVRPLYTSEARILIQNEESAFTRPTADSGRDPARAVLDEQAVMSQVQVLTSRDLILQVVKDLDLTDNAAFAKDAGVPLMRRFLTRFGLWRGSPESEEERAAAALADHLDVFQLSKSSVIAVEYTSGSPALAAEIANQLADVYIGWQRTAKIAQTKDATLWLKDQIEVLRARVAESEEAVETFRAKEGLYAGTNNVTLNAQQLSELNSQLILADAQKSEAEARAKLIKQMLADKGDIDATPEVLKSQLIINLIEQRVQVQRQLAELSATLLPSHPRIQQLKSELADVRAQVRDEAAKVVRSLENEAQVAAAREASLRASLNAAKTKSAGLSDAEIKLRALEREAKANRDLLESYLARYQDAAARHDMGAAPAQAAIVSRAHAPVLPSFPKRGPLSLLVMAATLLLALATVLARELIGAPATATRPIRHPEPGMRRHATPEPVPAKASPPPPRKTTPAAASSQSASRTLPVVIPPPPPAAEARPATEAAVKPAAASSSTPAATVTAAPPWQAKKPPLKPSWLRTRDDPEPPASAAQTPPPPKETKKEPETVSAPEAPPKPAATGLLDRLRREFNQGRDETSAGAPKPKSHTIPKFLDRFRRVAEAKAAATEGSQPTPKGADMSALSPNDLRHYLTQRIAAAGSDDPDVAELPPAPKIGNGKMRPVLRSLDAVLNHVLTSTSGGLPRALLVAGISSKADATQVAIRLARALIARKEQVVLVDLARGASAVSGPLGMPRAPGFTDLAAGRATFAEVIRIDDDTPLQVITAGHPTVRDEAHEPDRFMRVFEALTEAYGCVVLHADVDTVRALTPALKFELPVMVAVLAEGEGTARANEAMSTFQALGCPVVVYEGGAAPRRLRLFGRSAAV